MILWDGARSGSVVTFQKTIFIERLAEDKLQEEGEDNMAETKKEMCPKRSGQQKGKIQKE